MVTPHWRPSQWGGVDKGCACGEVWEARGKLKGEGRENCSCNIKWSKNTNMKKQKQNEPIIFQIQCRNSIRAIVYWVDLKVAIIGTDMWLYTYSNGAIGRIIKTLKFADLLAELFQWCGTLKIYETHPNPNVLSLLVECWLAHRISESYASLLGCNTPAGLLTIKYSHTSISKSHFSWWCLIIVCN